jgi:hypothetical protein
MSSTLNWTIRPSRALVIRPKALPAAVPNLVSTLCYRAWIKAL